jgi:hypothetical protein
MSTSTDVNSPIEETDAEIELSAQELLALSAVRRDDELEDSQDLKPSRPPASTSLQGLRPPLLAAAAVGVAGTLFVLTQAAGVHQSAAKESEQVAPSESSAPRQHQEGEMVRFANPFDANEVFEFPAGTSQSQARDAVADVLLKRAVSRQKT